MVDGEHVTEDEIKAELAEHAKRIIVAQLEGWFMPPIPMVEKEWSLRWEAFRNG